MRFLCFLVMMFFSANASASYHFCEGKITRAWTDGSGNVFIFGTWRGAHTQICSVTKEWKGVDPEACKVWVSSVHLAYASQSDVTVRYNDTAAESCSTLATYRDAPAPNYVMVLQN